MKAVISEEEIHERLLELEAKVDALPDVINSTSTLAKLAKEYRQLILGWQKGRNSQEL